MICRQNQIKGGLLMKSRRIISVMILFLLACLLGGTVNPGIAERPKRMPPSEERIMQHLLATYNLTIDDSNPAALNVLPNNLSKGSKPVIITTEAAQKLVREYLRQKLGSKPEDRPNWLAVRERKLHKVDGVPVNIRHGRRFRQELLYPEGKPDVSPYCAPEVTVDRILILLVEFSDPAHNQLPQPPVTNNADYWRADFSPAHYQSMLFSRKKNDLSMANYFLQQSNGTYTVDGSVYGWFRLDHPESYYGADKSGGGTDAQNGPVWSIVRDVVKAVGDSIPWQHYDRDDPYDLDDDGVYDEPDGYIDHLMIVHAGAGQEVGGGAQGENAIWSHFSWANGGGAEGPGMGGIPTANPGVWVGAYTMQPENGAIGVFCHEFAHDLGLPDLYDTIFSGEASPCYWSLMARGAWLGVPQETQPSNISIWGRIKLGWVSPKIIEYRSRPQFIRLDRAENAGDGVPAIQINLPPENVTITTNNPYNGAYEWYSGSGDGLNNTLTREFDLTGIDSPILNFMTWFSIEDGYDFGLVEVSTDNGVAWNSIPGNLTKAVEGKYVLTGESKGWVQAHYDLTGYAGRMIRLRFRYYTDTAIILPGWAMDDITVDAAGFADGAENAAGNWTAKGWRIYQGREEKTVARYYLMELRSHYGFDRSLAQCHNSFGKPGIVELFPYTPGVLLWYCDGQYSENWVGKHPGHGVLLVVDSHPQPDAIDDNYLITRIQIRDAVFGVEPTLPATITLKKDDVLATQTFPAAPPVSRFDDGKSYWVADKPDNSTKLPVLGVNFQVLWMAEDQSQAFLLVYFE